MKDTISIRLLNTIQRGKELLSKETLPLIIGFVESQRMPDDSFMDKSGKTDIYYTFFGWMLSFVLGIKLDTDKTAGYLKKQDVKSMDLIHYAAYMRCRMLQSLLEGKNINLLLNYLFKTSVRPLEEISGVPHDNPESPYTQYIWHSLLEDCGQPVKNKSAILESLKAYRVPDGGYSNLPKSNSAATNATAAALVLIGQLDGFKQNDDTIYLQNIQNESGGFAATESSPIPDLLSTATALFALRCNEVQPKRSPADFIDAHWLECGGFSATLLEENSDVEYTFYGLLALGTL